MLRFAWRAALAAALLPSLAVAGPIVIRDTRVTDLGTTPVLGRGYSLSTNTFQSACLKDVQVTAPSYDFQYTFQEVDEESLKSSKTETSAQAKYSSWWISAEVSASAKTASQTKKTSQHLVVTLNMDTYYASVDEAGTPLSESAALLLQREDAPGFFAACGPNYVRGLTRNAQFVSLFTYETESTQRDLAFEMALKADLKRFGGGGGISNKSSFSDQASKKNLTITTRGWGLGKNESASLISYDLETFKAAIKEAFISMQNPFTGRVTSMEVIPWVENTAFQVALDLNAEDKVAGKVVPLHEKKDILSMNAEFLTEMERAARARLNSYYQAKMCDSYISAGFKDGKGQIIGGDRPLRNHRLGPAEKTPKKLTEVAGVVGPAKQQTLWKEYSDFVQGGAQSVSKCVAKLMASPDAPAAAGAARGAGAPDAGAAAPDGQGRGLFLKRFIDHPECLQLQAQFVAPKQDFEDYCMPEVI